LPSTSCSNAVANWVCGGSTCDKIAAIFVPFLTRDRAGFVNGQEIIVDGGFEHMLMSLVPRPGFERGN
jgi:hypothetical protein